MSMHINFEQFHILIDAMYVHCPRPSRLRIFHLYGDRPSRLRIFHLYGDVTIAGEDMQNLGLCLVLGASEQ
jgi:hypothetical protein